MRAVVQRVTSASVDVDGEMTGAIGQGLLVLLGVTHEDNESDADYLVDKIINLRIFDDDDGKMNRSLVDIGGALLVVSQFTLFGDARRGRRPSYTDAAPPEKANLLYEYFVAKARQSGTPVQTGVFQAMMNVTLVNFGPVTIMLDSKKLF
ncbi:MAG TPA: D-aminoacyl-tRNA deacylase [Blastocatellia bacterium]|nr:D-aminoacyl-tRNA deacylase [Blastocatellia bacterium]